MEATLPAEQRPRARRSPLIWAAYPWAASGPRGEREPDDRPVGGGPVEPGRGPQDQHASRGLRPVERQRRVERGRRGGPCLHVALLPARPGVEDGARIV